MAAHTVRHQKKSKIRCIALNRQRAGKRKKRVLIMGTHQPNALSVSDLKRGHTSYRRMVGSPAKLQPALSRLLLGSILTLLTEPKKWEWPIQNMSCLE
jgi:hypothetical protein